MNLFKYLTHDTQMMKESFSNKLVPKWESLLEENQENPSNMEIIIRFRQIHLDKIIILRIQTGGLQLSYPYRPDYKKILEIA